jgi:hypothetical protein
MPVEMGQMMTHPGVKPVDRSGIKPVYLVIAEHPVTASKFQYFVTKDFTEIPPYIEFRGFELTKKQADELLKNPRKEHGGTPANEKIPWPHVRRIKNITYKLEEK